MLILRRWWPVLSLLAVLALLVAGAEGIGTPAATRTITEALITLIIVIGLYIFVGNSGVLSFGHISFVAIGAYGTAWQTCCPDLKAFTMNGLPEFLLNNTYPVMVAALSSGLLAAAFAFLTGAAIMRLSGLAASIATLALLFIVWVTYSNWENVTRGKGSLVGLPTYVTPVVALGFVAGALIIAHLFQESRFGLALRASREDLHAAKASGINVYLQRLIAFTLSGFVVGIGGVLHAHYLGTIQIDNYFLSMTLLTMAMLVVGGQNSMAGAVCGVLALTAVVEVFRALENGIRIGGATLSLPNGFQELALALAMLLILVWRPRGLSAGREVPWPWRASTPAPLPAAPKASA